MRRDVTILLIIFLTFRGSLGGWEGDRELDPSRSIFGLRALGVLTSSESNLFRELRGKWIKGVFRLRISGKR